jgi:hypothetical protein
MKKYLPIVVLLGCASVFAFGIVYLFELRFQAGDIYPPYSSLRADPLGTMALYESLGKVPGLSVRRDFSDSNRLPEEPQTVYLHLAGDPYEWDGLPSDMYRDIQGFLSRGGRLAITFFPQTEQEIFDYNDEGTNRSESARAREQRMTPPKRIKKDDDDTDDGESYVSLEDEWGFHTDFVKLEPDGDHYSPVPVFKKGDLPLPDMLEWHSGLVFKEPGQDWQVIYSRGTNAVVIERKFGAGSVVLATDSYFVSNEAMTKDRHADLLAWFIGTDKNVVFDESHFGIVETSGVATLMRKYRLEGLAGGLVLLAILFIWKNSMSLVPPVEEGRREDFVTGKDSAGGFVNLLRRSIARRTILATCFAEWKKSTAQKGKNPASRLQRAEAIFTAEMSSSNNNPDPVELYKKISETLGTRNQNL